MNIIPFFLKQTKSPEYTRPLLSQLTFWWINSLINTGFRKELKREDLWEIDYREGSEFVNKKLESDWNPKASEYIRKVRAEELAHYAHHISKNQTTSFTNENTSEQVKLNLINGEKKDQVRVEIAKKIPKPSLGFSLVKIFSFKFFGIVAIKGRLNY